MNLNMACTNRLRSRSLPYAALRCRLAHACTRFSFVSHHKGNAKPEQIVDVNPTHRMHLAFSRKHTFTLSAVGRFRLGSRAAQDLSLRGVKYSSLLERCSGGALGNNELVLGKKVRRQRPLWYSGEHACSAGLRRQRLAKQRHHLANHQS